MVIFACLQRKRDWEDLDGGGGISEKKTWSRMTLFSSSPDEEDDEGGDDEDDEEDDDAKGLLLVRGHQLALHDGTGQQENMRQQKKVFIIKSEKN